MNSFRTIKHSFKFLNATQFLGALNDNIFKLIIIYLLINVQGVENSSVILSTAGAVFVIPFLLFSSAAGVLADKLRKSSILVAMKISEIIVMSLSLIAIILKSAFFLYTLLFFMAMQSAVFGPSKYGIIPEIVPPKNVSKANGALNSLTYLSIIIGTFLASFITDVTNKNFVIAGSICVVIAFLGFFSSLGIIKTEPKRTRKKINPLFIYEIYKTLVICSRKRYLISSVLGSAFFLFMGGFVQLNIIPYAIESLNLSEVGGGYLFLATAIGIAIGSLVAGKLSKDRVEVGMACLSGFFLAFILILLGIFSSLISVVIILLVLLGFFGGIFLIPFDSFIQVSSPDKKRGRIVAASNFLSFVGVLFASIFLYLISGALALSSATGFIFMGIATLLFSIFITGRMSELFFSYFARKILLKFFKVRITNIPSPSSYIVLLNGSWLHSILMFSFLPNLKIFTAGRVLRDFPYFRGFLNSLYLIKKRKKNKVTLIRLFAKAHKYKRRINFVCLLLDKDFTKKDIFNFSKSSHGEKYPDITFLDISKRNNIVTYSFFKK
jgi:acyl-[acyl-carrier-protein]-phospholipid O-acyltransferase/long-chain-fatty-acid--[acyl-carrier-protein] ligase